MHLPNPSLIAISIILLIGCGADETPPELPNIEYKLVITDSIGVEIGEDEYMFAWPINPTHSPDGDILIADRLKHTVFVYTPEGEFIRTIGREGEGPGEFRLPSGLEFYSDGRLLIGDADGISLYDSSYEYQGQLTWSGFDKPWLQTAIDSCGFIGSTMTMMPGENGIETVKTIGRWDGEGAPSVEYFSIESEFNPENGIDHTESRESDIIFCATRDGRVFYSQSSIDEFEIHGCETDGTPFLRIVDEDFHRVRKNEDELQVEMDNLISFFNRMSGGSPRRDIDIKLDPYKHAVLGMFIDGEERLWVRLGYYSGAVFRIYDFSGEILFHAMVKYDGNPVDLNSWEITGDEHGFLGHNTSHQYYQRIYMLALVVAE